MGASWKTSAFGWFLIGTDILAFAADVIKTQGLPATMMEWFVFSSVMATGIGKLFSKDYDVSNSQHPAAATVVAPAAAVAPNPAATAVQ